MCVDGERERNEKHVVTLKHSLSMDEIVLGLGVLAAWRLWQQFQTDYCLREAAEFGPCKYHHEAREAVLLFCLLIIVTLVVVKADKWVRAVSYDVGSCISSNCVAKLSLCHENTESQERIEKELADSRNDESIEETTGHETVMNAESIAASNTRTGAIAASIEESSIMPHVEVQLPHRRLKHSNSSSSLGPQRRILCQKSAEGIGVQQMSNNSQVRSSRTTCSRCKKNKNLSEMPVQSESSFLNLDVDTARINKPSSAIPDSGSQSSSSDISPLQSPAFKEQEMQHASAGSESPRPTSFLDVRHAESSQKRYTGQVVKDGTDNHAMAVCSERERLPHHRRKEGGGKNFMAFVFTGPWNAMNRAAKGIWRHSSAGGRLKHQRKQSRKACIDLLEDLKIGLAEVSNLGERPMSNRGEAFQKIGRRKLNMNGSDETSGQSLDGFALAVMTIPICLASFILLMLQTQQPPSLPNDAPAAGHLPYVFVLLECALLSSLHQAISTAMLPLGLGSFSERALVIVLAIGVAKQPLLCAWTMAIHQVLLTIMHHVGHFQDGELWMITQAFSLWTVDALLCTAFTILSPTSSDEWSRVFPIPPRRSKHFFVIQSGIIGLVASRIVLASMELIWMWWHAWQQRRASTFTRPIPRSSPPATSLPLIVVCVVLLAGIMVTICWWMEVLMEGESPILWIVRQVFYSTFTSVRVGLCLYWVLLMALFLPFIPWAVERFKLQRIVARKLFHFLALAMFLPAVILDPEFLSFAIGVAIGFVILLEFLPDVMVSMVRSYYKSFLDHNDSQKLAVTHIALLFGCVIPLWLTEGAGATACSPFPLHGPFLSASGILVLGIGDSVSALIGSTYGRWRWTRAANHRTVEGSVAMFISLLMAFTLLQEFTTPNIAVNCPGLDSTCPLGSSYLLLPVGIVVILEAFSTELDNIVLPPYAFASLVLLLLGRCGGGAAKRFNSSEY